MPRPEWSNRLEKPENEGMPRLQRRKYNLIVLKRKVLRLHLLTAGCEDTIAGSFGNFQAPKLKWIRH